MPADAPPPLDQTTRAVLDEIATEQWSVEPYARDEVPMFILSGDLRILQNYNLDIEEMHAVAALPEVVRQLRQAESERTTLAAQVQGLREALAKFDEEVHKQSRPGGQWVGVPKYAIRNLFDSTDAVFASTVPTEQENGDV